MDTLSSRVGRTDKNVQGLMCRTAALEEGGVASSSSVAGDVGGTRGGRSGSSHPGNPHSRGP
eukprot:6342591-Pyramimonas_sp.AAC.1